MSMRAPDFYLAGYLFTLDLLKVYADYHKLEPIDDADDTLLAAIETWGHSLKFRSEFEWVQGIDPVDGELKSYAMFLTGSWQTFTQINPDAKPEDMKRLIDEEHPYVKMVLEHWVEPYEAAIPDLKSIRYSVVRHPKSLSYPNFAVEVIEHVRRKEREKYKKQADALEAAALEAATSYREVLDEENTGV